MKFIQIIFFGVFMAAVLGGVGAGRAAASFLYVAAAQQEVYQGQTFAVDWFLDTQGQSINAVRLDIHYDPKTLEAIETVPGNSLVSLWVRQPAVATAGWISLEGGIPAGITGAKVPIFRAVFKAVAAGQAGITLEASSRVLLNDGLGTPEVLSFAPVHFVIQPGSPPVTVTSATHPDEDKWYQSRRVELEFDPQSGQAYSTSFSSNAEQIPDPVPRAVPERFAYDLLPDGVYYFKVNTQTGPASWREAAVFRVQIDATPPEEFAPIISTDPALFGGRPFIAFNALDKTSGIEKYEIKVGMLGRQAQAESPFQLRQSLVDDTVTVIAYDRAGNSRSIAVSVNGFMTVGQFRGLMAVLGVLLAAIVLFYIYRKRRTK